MPNRITKIEAKITVLTLGVLDLERSVKFYQYLGFRTPGIVGREFEHGAVAFFDLHSGLKLALWPLSSIAHDTSLPQASQVCPSMTIGHNVSSKDQVDWLIELARGAGAVITKAPGTTFYGGYSAYFQDPDGHLWDIVWNSEFAT